MLSARLLSFQLELHVHRRWLSGFIQRTQASAFSTTTISTQSAVKHHGTAAADKRGSRSSRFSVTGKKFASKKLDFKRPPSQVEDSGETNPIIEDLRQKARAANITHVIEDYTALNAQDKSTLSKRDAREIAQCLHHNVRKEKQSAANQHRQSTVRDLVEFAETIVKDVKDGRIATSGKVHVHLIGIFKESGSREKGVQYWKWLVEQGEEQVDVDCYGAAIELLAVNGAPLVELENLYQEALGRFPGNFAAYHLSPDAVLPDREQPFTVGGIPISLLQGVLTARLLSGDTRNAYLALDTAMRILPDQVPQRLFWVFLEERPLQEAYAVFALACYGGNAVTGAYYRSMLGALRTHSTLNSPVQHALGVRAMLSVTHMFIGNGGAVASNSVNELVIAITQFLRLKGVDALSPKEKQPIVKAVMEIIRGVFEVFARYGAKPNIPAFNSIITNLGGFGGSKQTIGIALKDADALGLAPTDVTWRSILAVAGMFRDKGLVERTWAHLRDSRIEVAENPKDSDFHALVKPAHLSGAIGFAQEELEKFRVVLGDHVYETLALRLEDPTEAENASTEDTAPIDIGALLGEIEKIKADIELIKDRTQGSPAVQDFSEQTLPLTLQPLKSDLALPDTQLRKIYDEFTSNSSAQPTAPREADAFDELESPARNRGFSLWHKPVTNAKSKTNVPLGTLRFESWKMVNYLLEMSEKHDRAFRERVDAALDAGRAPPRRMKGFGAERKEVVSWGLSSVEQVKARGEQDAEEVGEEEFGRVRDEIRRLRGGHDRE